MQTDTQRISNPGKQFIAPERYSQESIIGAGGMKTVIRVLDTETGRHVAMAVAKDFTDRGTEQFLQEAKLTAGLEHPNIVPVHEVGVTAEGIPYFTMKLLTGETLQKILEELERRNPEYVKKYTLRRMLQIFLKICDALAFAHARGILHLDLKPANIQVGEYGEVLVLDWGLARFGGNTETADAGIVPEDSPAGQTADGIVRGTLEYMAPEQLLGQSQLRGPKWDVYALGAILHAMFTLKPPVDAGSKREAVLQIMAGKIRGIRREDLFRIPGTLQFIMYKALERRPQYRYDSVADLRGDVERYLAGFPAKAENAGMFTRLVFLLRRRRLFVLMLVFLFFAALITLGFFVALLYYKSLELEIYRHTEQQRVRAEERRASLEREMRHSAHREWKEVFPQIPLSDPNHPEENKLVLDGTVHSARAVSRFRTGGNEFRVQGKIRWNSGNGPFFMESGTESWQKSLRFVFSPRQGLFQIMEKQTGQVLFERPFVFTADSEYHFDIQGLRGERNRIKISVSINRVKLTENFIPDFKPSSSRIPVIFCCSGASVELTDFRLMELGIPARVRLSDFGDILLSRGAFREARDVYRNVEHSEASPELRYRARLRERELNALLAVMSRLPFREAEIRSRCPGSRISMQMEGPLLSLSIEGGKLPKDLDLSGLPIRILHLADCTVEDMKVLSCLHLTEFHAEGCGIRSLSLLDMSNMMELTSYGNPIRDLSPLRGSPLTRLTIMDGQVEDLSPLRLVPNLKTVELNGNRIHDISPLAGLSLEHLNLTDNRIRDISPLAGLSSLRVLLLNNNQITRIAPLRGKNFRSLGLSGSRISDPEVIRTVSVRDLQLDSAGLSYLPVPREPEKMEGLSLCSNSIGELPESLTTMSSLRRLDVSDNQLTKLTPLKELKHLCQLDVSDNRLTDLSELQELDSLVQLNCSDNPLLVDNSAFRIVRPSVLWASSIRIPLDSPIFRYPPEKCLVICSDKTPAERVRSGVDGLEERNISRKITEDLQLVCFAKNGDVSRLISKGVRIGGSIFLLIPMSCSFESALKIARELNAEIPLMHSTPLLRAELEKAGVPVWFRKNTNHRPLRVSSRDFRFTKDERFYGKKSACLILQWKQ